MQSPLRPPVAVRQAIERFQSAGQFKVIPPKESETSYIFKWGVRVEYRDDNGTLTTRWACLADDECRNSGANLFRMSAGKTSRAARHLRVVHHLISPKSEVELAGKRKRDAEIAMLQASPLYTKNPARLNLLLETLRIINHNLPLKTGEYDESRKIEALVVRKEMQTVINAKRVKESIVELYQSTKAEVAEYIADNRESYPNFTLVADFWTCKTTGDKFLGIRVYLVDKEWQFNSVLLGTKKFNPAYSDREGGIRKPFKMWLTKMLEDFGLTTSDFYGSASDAGGDVKCMLQTELKLKWEWCFAHMAHAATKMSCGVGGKTSQAANPEVAELISKMTLVITQIKLVSTVGNLFSELCKEKTRGASTRLLGYSASRFLSVTNAMKRVLDKWPAIVAWYDERGRLAVRERKPPPEFPLANRQSDLIQVLSILTPVADIKRDCQAERASQVEVLMALYMTRIDYLAPDQPIPHYLSTDENPTWIQSSSLTFVAATTRKLLREALDERFFSRYFKDDRFSTNDFVLEMMLKLHPVYKDTQESLNRAVIMCCRQHGKTAREAVDRLREVNDKIRSNLLDLLKRVAGPIEAVDVQPTTSTTGLSRLEARFAPHISRPPTTSRTDRRAEDELDRWLDDPIGILRNEDMTAKESVLQFWQRLETSGEYRIIPKAVRVLYAIPSSSCQIERDFSVSGEMVSPQRTSLAGENIDMSIFLNRNPDFVNLVQCEEIPQGKHHLYTCPSIDLDFDMDAFFDEINTDILAEFVSSTALSFEEEDMEEKSPA